MKSNLFKCKSINWYIHYVLIYLLILIPGSTLFQKIIPFSFKAILFLLFLFLSVILKKYRNKYVFFPIIVVCFFGVLVRAISGGIGVSAIIDIILPILVLNIAYNYNKKAFLTRFVNLSTIFFSISLLFFVIQLLNRNFFSEPVFKRFYSQSIGTYPWQTDYYGNGFILFSTYDIHPERNCGIFTEPGVYQIIINSCLCILLFFSKELLISKKKINLYIIISILTLLSSQSTTGLIGLAIIFIMYTCFYKYKNKKISKYFLSTMIVLFIILLIDFGVRKNNSILYANFFEKIFNNGKIDFDNGTGQYRIGTMEIAINSIMKNPLGVGYDNFNKLNDISNAGAGFFTFGAVFGIIPFMFIIFWLIYPYFKKKNIFFLILFLLLFFNTAMAQTYFLYPGLLIGNYYFMLQKSQHEKYGNTK